MPLPEGLESLAANRPNRVSEAVHVDELWNQLLAACPEAHHQVLDWKRQGLPLAEDRPPRQFAREQRAGPGFCTTLLAASRGSKPPRPSATRADRKAANEQEAPASLLRMAGKTPPKTTRRSGIGRPPRSVAVRGRDRTRDGGTVAQEALRPEPRSSSRGSLIPGPPTSRRCASSTKRFACAKSAANGLNGRKSFSVPQWRDSLAMLLDCHRLIDAGESTPTFPEAGERLGEIAVAVRTGPRRARSRLPGNATRSVGSAAGGQNHSP